MLSPEECADIILSKPNTIVFSGAGISTAAGIPDFRGANGMFATGKYDPDTVFNITYFKSDPEPFWEFTRDFLEILEGIQPTFTHRFFAQLQKVGKVSLTITQNIDMLHQTAGAQPVIEVHGSYSAGHCMRSGREYSFDQMKQMLAQQRVPRSESGDLIKPNIVFFGETVHGLEQAQEEVLKCDLMFVLGSSLTVFPAAELPHIAPGAVIVVNLGEVNFKPSEQRHIVHSDLDEYFRKVARRMDFDVE